jgi:hypothetical protein
MMDKIIRERQTTERIQSFDMAEIVDEIHALEDSLSKAQDTNHHLRDAIDKARSPTTEIGGSFMQWHREVLEILGEALKEEGE